MGVSLQERGEHYNLIPQFYFSRFHKSGGEFFQEHGFFDKMKFPWKIS
jgi:hypothetical protein